MSLEVVLARISALQSAFAPPAPPAPKQIAGNNSFAGMLQNAVGPGAVGVASPMAPIAGGGKGAAIVAAAAGEVGQKEQPPGSNDSPRIAQYRQAVAGSPGPGPWCAYFVSWAARQAGMPVGEGGRGDASVDSMYAWAQRVGRAEGGDYKPKPGDLIIWDEHMGIVEAVMPDGSVKTIEGNSSDQVIRRTHPAGSALGYIRMS